jgi:hypothetical protein
MYHNAEIAAHAAGHFGMGLSISDIDRLVTLTATSRVDIPLKSGMVELLQLMLHRVILHVLTAANDRFLYSLVTNSTIPYGRDAQSYSNCRPTVKPGQMRTCSDPCHWYSGAS